MVLQLHDLLQNCAIHSRNYDQEFKISLKSILRLRFLSSVNYLDFSGATSFMIAEDLPLVFYTLFL